MMRGQTQLTTAARALRVSRASSFVCQQCRAIQISAAPSTDAAKPGSDAFTMTMDANRDVADARFEVLGSPYSMLSVTLSPSQRLYTRRGTLVAVAGKPDDAQSTLSILNPLTRTPFGVPFLYQRITASSPITALISTKSPTTTFSILHLDGTTDWMVAQRNALLAWTGHTLSLSPRIQYGLSVANWGNTFLTGRGLAAVSAPGQIYQLTLGDGEEFVAHPGSVVAYSVSRVPPRPFRFKSSTLRLSLPSIPMGWFTELKFVQTIVKSDAYKWVGRVLHSLRTMARRTIWGDRLFLQFTGPTTLLMSSRGVRVADVLTNKDVNEIADTPAGAIQEAVELPRTEDKTAAAAVAPATSEQAPSALHIASVRRDGKVTFEDAKDLKEFVR